ncbi:hypothetical protein HDU76_007538, partial [Blyttiomyces sp. JEL0837]
MRFQSHSQLALVALCLLQACCILQSAISGSGALIAYASPVKPPHVQFRDIQGMEKYNQHGLIDTNSVVKQRPGVGSGKDEKHQELGRRTNIADCDLVIAAFPSVTVAGGLDGGCCGNVAGGDPFGCDAGYTVVTD